MHPVKVPRNEGCKDCTQQYHDGLPGQVEGENHILDQDEHKRDHAEYYRKCLCQEHRVLRADNEEEYEENEDYEQHIGKRPEEFRYDIFLGDGEHIRKYNKDNEDSPLGGGETVPVHAGSFVRGCDNLDQRFRDYSWSLSIGD